MHCSIAGVSGVKCKISTPTLLEARVGTSRLGMLSMLFSRPNLLEASTIYSRPAGCLFRLDYLYCHRALFTTRGSKQGLPKLSVRRSGKVEVFSSTGFQPVHDTPLPVLLGQVECCIGCTLLTGQYCVGWIALDPLQKFYDTMYHMYVSIFHTLQPKTNLIVCTYLSLFWPQKATKC